MFDGQIKSMSTRLITYLGKLYWPHCDLTGIIVSKGNHPQMALIQVSEIL